MKKQDNLTQMLIGAQDSYNYSCIFANSGTGHTIYCNNPDDEAPRKCTYRLCEERMKECTLFSDKNKQL